VQAVYHSFPKVTGCINPASKAGPKAAAAHGMRATMLLSISYVIAAAADRCINCFNWAGCC